MSYFIFFLLDAVVFSGETFLERAKFNLFIYY